MVHHSSIKSQVEGGLNFYKEFYNTKQKAEAKQDLGMALLWIRWCYLSPPIFLEGFHLQKQLWKCPKILAATKLTNDRNRVSGSCFDILVSVQDKQNTVKVGREGTAVQMPFFAVRKFLPRACKTMTTGGKKKNDLTWKRKHLIHFTVLTSISKYLSMKNASGTELGVAKYIAQTGYQCASAAGSRMQSKSSRNVPSWSPPFCKLFKVATSRASAHC